MKTFIKRVETKAVVQYNSFSEPVWLQSDSFSAAIDLLATRSWQYQTKGLSPSRLKILNTLLNNLLISQPRRQWLEDCHCIVIYHRVKQTDTGHDCDFTDKARVGTSKTINLVKINGSGLYFRSLILNLADFVGWEMLDINAVTRDSHGISEIVTKAWSNLTKAVQAKSFGGNAARVSSLGRNQPLHQVNRLKELSWSTLSDTEK